MVDLILANLGAVADDLVAGAIVAFGNDFVWILRLSI